MLREATGRYLGRRMFHLGITLFLVVLYVPALLNEFSAAVVKWVPVMTTDAAADVPCSDMLAAMLFAS